MSKVAVVTDTISHMPQELADKCDIKVVPMGIVIDGKAYPETEVDLDDYYQKLLQITETEKLPTSSSVTVGQFLEAFRELSQKAAGIVYIGHSIRLGMSTNAATQAKKMAEEELPNIQIEVIDSGTAIGAQAFIAVEAARAAAAGKGFPEVVEVAKSMMPKVKYILLADSLEYLSSGGRILDGRPWVAAKVSTKALLETDATTGKVHAPLARYKTKAQAVKGLLDILKERCGNQKLHVIITHINVPDEAEELKKKVSSQFDCVELYVNPTWPVVGRHVGPGCIMLGWWAED
ncbi:MAG: DegV family protein [Dehalococcoidia bacterium]|nr:MAG: DegV family protein [Dehalococcoidia bacterium]